MDWLFQCNPKRFDLAKFLEDGGVVNWWTMNQGKNLVSPKDRVFFWQTGEQAGLLAIGRVTSPVYQKENPFGHDSVDVVFEYKIIPPLTREEARTNKTLHDFVPFKGFQGTNFPIRDPAILAALEKVVEGRLVPISGKPPLDEPVQEKLDDAIKNAKHEIVKELHNYVLNMDPTAFEHLVRALFLKLGYRSVVVTKRSGDGGIDVKGVFIAGGIQNIKTCIQVKRQQAPVGRPIVQNIRGSLGPHEVGVVVTSGRFSEDARNEAQDQTKAPITLIDGQQLVELLLAHQIGSRQINLKAYRLVPEELTGEKLQTLVEVAEESES